MKILLVDDEVSFLEQAEIFLTNEEERFVIDTSPSAKDAMSKLEENRYDAIISDYQMPNIDGLEFLEIIREEKGLEIPFVIFTGKGREEVAIKALNIGADRYIQKGGDPKSQYGVLAQAVKQEIKHYMESKKRKEVEAKLSSLVEASEDPIYIVDRDCNILFANKAELEKTGMRLDEIVNSSFIESHPESDAIEFRERVNDVLKTGEPKVHEVKHEKNGKYYYRTLSPIKNPSTDEIDRIAVISKDISDRKKMEDDLKESEEKYRKLVETTGDLIFIHDEKGNIKFVNNAGLEFSGYTEDEVMGKNIMEFLPENELETLLERKKKRIEEGNQDRQNFETAFINKDGERMEVDIQSTPLIENGEFNGELVVARDITERKEKEEKLAIAEKKYKTLFEELSDAIFLEDKEGNILEVNDEVCDLLGYIEEELTDMSVDDLVPEGQGKLLPGEIDEATLNGKPLETINLSKDGKRIPVEVRGKLIELQGKERLLVSLRDVSERKNKEEELKEARARMSTLLSTIPSYV
ncbi:MAG: PAS domain S-box protein, partial [Thermoplasmatota archaeon]